MYWRSGKRILQYEKSEKILITSTTGKSIPAKTFKYFAVPRTEIKFVLEMNVCL